MKPPPKSLHRPTPATSANTVVVTRKVVPQPDGTANIEVQLRMDGAPVPDRRYAAEFAWIAADDDFVRLSFGQWKLEGTARSVLTIMMSVEAAHRVIRSVTTDGFLERARGFLARNQVRSRALSQVEVDPAQAVMLHANLVAIAHSGREACLDFYHASAWELRATIEAGNITVDPIVRVDAPTSLAIPLLERLVELGPSLPPDLT